MNSLIRLHSLELPRENVVAEPKLQELIDSSEWSFWMGSGRSINGQAVRRHEAYCLSLFWPASCINAGVKEHGWDKYFQAEDLILPRSSEGLHPPLAKLIEGASHMIRVKYLKHKNLKDWVDRSQRIVLIGEAAHPADPPCAIQGPALCIEDAATFSHLFTRLAHTDQIPRLLAAYTSLRQTRAYNVNQAESMNAQAMWLEEGSPEQQERDAAMKERMEAQKQQFDEGLAKDLWEETLQVMGYYAMDAVDDWWQSWGALSEFSQQRDAGFQQLNLQFSSVSIVTDT